MTDNRLVDPWMLAQIVVQNTRRLMPFVAVQPLYMHPYAVAKMIATFASLHGRGLYVNWVAGGFKNDRRSLADDLPHDAVYDRLVEYATIVRQLTDGRTVTFHGRYCDLDRSCCGRARPLQAEGGDRRMSPMLQDWIVEGARVGVHMPKSARAVASRIRVLKAGCVYVPTETAGAPVRNAKILRRCEPEVVLLDGCGPKVMEELELPWRTTRSEDREAGVRGGGRSGDDHPA